MKGRIVLSSSPVDPEVKVRTEEPEKSWPGSYIKNFYFFSPHVQCKIKRNHTLLSLFRSALTCLPCRSTQASLHSFVARRLGSRITANEKCGPSPDRQFF